MGRYVVKIAKKKYNPDKCDARGYPIEEIEYTGEEYETTIDPDGDYVEMGPDGWETHTVIDGEKPKTVFKQSHHDNAELIGKFVYRKDSKKKILLECPYKEITQAVVPDCVEEIGSFAFDECPDLKTIVLPPSVKRIDPEAFVNHGFHDSVTLTFTKDVQTIPSNLIPNNSSKLPFLWVYYIKKIIIPDSVTRIEDYALQNMSLWSITIPDSIEYMGKDVFKNSSISEVHISEAGWLRFKDNILDGCKMIKKVICGKKLVYYNSNSILYDSADSILKGFSEIGDEAFSQNDQMKEEYLIKELKKLNNENDKVSEFKKYTIVKIPDSVQSIGKRAFMGCTAWRTVILPDSVTYLGDEAFKDCTNLQEIAIPKNIPFLGRNTFEGCNKLKIVLLSKKLYEKSKNVFPQTTEFLFIEDVPPSLIDAFIH